MNIDHKYLLMLLNKNESHFRHARKHFSQAEGGQLDEVRQVMGMLAFPSDTHISPYKVNYISAPILYYETVLILIVYCF